MADSDQSTGAFVPDENASLLGRVLDEYLADLQAGKSPDRQELLARYPALAGQLEACLAGIDFIQRTSHASDAPAKLGDFRIVREVGRGGMGVVYEAEQISLKRRVALKVLRFGSVADADAMQRFQREAETVATLHHTNIVPIFAVGQEQGVHYYAMQFIVGKSLADLLPAFRPGPERKQLDADHFRAVARWGLQGAEALAHAHQRGVIHRDIKPSNLLLDADGVLWLTDFGLAKRADEVTMTISGVLLGTPRYMSPEQATAAKQPIDHRTDLYSLGATLYELATGTPVFSADTPHAVLSQILHNEPVAPRQVEGRLPRDLETIILKCLAKEPGRRYESAQTLADDLRAFLDGRSIKARRASVAERAVRWARKQRRSTTVAAVATIASLLLVIAGYFAWSWNHTARQAHLSLSTNAGHLKAEVLDEAETQVIARFTVPTQEPQTLEPGRYKVRLSGAGQRSDTYRFSADRGATYKFSANPIDSRLWETPMTRGNFELVQFEKKTDALTIHQDVVARIDGASGQTVWQFSMAQKRPAMVGKDSVTQFFHAVDLNYPRREVPGVARPAVDVNGDGVADVIYASRTMTALFAFSGKDGSPLWYRNTLSELPKGLKDDDLTSRSPIFNRGVIGTPLVAALDGKSLVIAAFYSQGENAYLRKNGDHLAIPAEKWIEAFDAKTGQTLWRFVVAREDSGAAAVTPCVMKVADVVGKKTVLVALGPRLMGIELATGTSAWPIHDAGRAMLRSTHWVTLDGGDVGVVLEKDEDNRRLVELITPRDGKTRWQSSLGTAATSSEVSAIQEVVVADLDGDDKDEVVVLRRLERDPSATRGFLGMRDDPNYHSVDVCVLDAATGNERWSRPVKTLEFPVERLVVGPDANGDKIRDIYVASIQTDRFKDNRYQPSVFVDALSGRDGASLWWWRREWTFSERQYYSPWDRVGEFDTLRFGPFGPDGRPLLLLTCMQGRDAHPPVSPTTFALSCGDGRLQHIIPQFAVVAVADMNGDGLVDLVGHDMPPTQYWTGHGKLQALRSYPPTAWSMLGSLSREWLGADYNGDGTGDLLGDNNISRIRTFSGANGGTLWQSSTPGWARTALPLPHGDLDGDGVADVLTFDPDSTRLLAVSGKSGATLWSTRLFGSEERVTLMNSRLPYIDCQTLDGEQPSVLVMAITDSNMRSNTQALHLMRLESHSGRMVWNVALQRQKPGPEQNGPKSAEVQKDDVKREPPLALGDARFKPSFADVDGDGVRDVILWCPAPGPSAELRAHSGRDGKLLWQRHMFKEATFETPAVNGAFWPAPLMHDLNGDGIPDVIVTNVIVTKADDGSRKSITEATALNGRDGAPLWTWKLDTAEQLAWSNQWYAAQPHLLDLGADGKLICLSGYDRTLKEEKRDPKSGQVITPATSGAFLALLDMRGKEVQRFDIPEFVNFQHRASYWVHDLDGDGRTDILYQYGVHLRAMTVKKTPAGAMQWSPLWKWEFPQQSQEFRTIQPATKDRPAVVVVWGEHQLQGLDGRTGATRWRCDVGDQFHTLATDEPSGIPHVVFNGPYGKDLGTIHCRQALPTTPTGEYASPTATARPPASGTDPRLARSLPWTGDAYVKFPEILTQATLASALFFGLVPMAIVALRRRGWHWRWFVVPPLLMLALAWLIVGHFVGYDGRSVVAFTVPLIALMLALLGLPGWVFVVALGKALWQRQWRRTVNIVALAVVVGVVLGVMCVKLDRRPAWPGEYYSFAGWYKILPAAVYASGLLMTVGLALQPLARIWRKPQSFHVPN